MGRWSWKRGRVEEEEQTMGRWSWKRGRVEEERKEGCSL